MADLPILFSAPMVRGLIREVERPGTGKTQTRRILKLATKVSLSHARPVAHGAEGLAVLQVEPLLHRRCAAISMQHCPSLKRDIAAGSLMVRQVTRSRVQFSIMGPQFVSHYVPGYEAKPTDRIIGHAKVELLRWVDRDVAWLEAA